MTKAINIENKQKDLNSKTKSKNLKWYQCIFSIKNKESKNNKWYKIIRIFGLKFNLKNATLTQKKQIEKLNCDLQKNTQNHTQELQKIKNLHEKKYAKLNKIITNQKTEIQKLQTEIGYFNNWRENFYKDYPDSFPIRLTEQEKEAIVNEISCSKKYLEFGSGGSTFIAINTQTEIYSVESDANWIDYLKSYKAIYNATKSGKLNFSYVNIGKTKEWGYPVDDSMQDNYPTYSSEIFKKIPSVQDVDLVFVDGRFRVACALQTILNCSKNTKIMVHDYTFREYYHIIEQFLDIVKVVDTLAIFKIKEDINIEYVKELYEQYKYNVE